MLACAIAVPALLKDPLASLAILFLVGYKWLDLHCLSLCSVKTYQLCSFIHNDCGYCFYRSALWYWAWISGCISLHSLQQLQEALPIRLFQALPRWQIHLELAEECHLYQ